ncbi:hypothetical protein ABZ682_22615 [Streptomyces griseoviridis]|uniref:hypothetical protein n=1 Tax=Streptomyces griseoviridis TaxID=45398 RepID=UPI0033E75A5D
MTRQTVASDHQQVAWQCELEPGREILAKAYATMQAAQAVVRGVRTGRYRGYRPAGHFEASAHPHADGVAVWVRYVHGLYLPPLPETVTVRVPDYGSQTGGECVRVVEVEICARCPRCGGPRGEKQPDAFVRDGAHHVWDVWRNGCGHQDDYEAVLREASRGLKPARRRGTEPVEGGKYARAVGLICEVIAVNPWTSALRIIELLNGHGELEAAQTVRQFSLASVSGPSTSAKSAALYLVHLDTQAADTSTSTGSQK